MRPDLHQHGRKLKKVYELLNETMGGFRHIERAPELPEGPPDSRAVLHLTRSSYGLDGSVEIRDLLHYLADRVLHSSVSYGVNTRGK